MRHTKHFVAAGVALSLTFMAFACNTAEKAAVDNTNYVAYVDPYIGSGGHGHVFVGANVPNGALQVGPQNIFKGWDWCSGYHYSDSIIIGFSHTHLSGTGCSDLGDVLIMPYSGVIRTARGEQNNIKDCSSSYFSHKNESVSPGYYSLLMDNGVKVELTASERVAMHRYHFPENQTAHILINLKEGIDDSTYESYMKKVDDYTVEGYRYTHGWSPNRKVFFTLKSEQPIGQVLMYNDDTPAGNDQLTGKGIKAVLTFKDTMTLDAKIKVAISSVSCANALMNLSQEMPGWDFEKVHKDAVEKWNKKLSCVKIETKDERAKKIFYTAMYHTFIAPVLYCDVNGQFRGIDDKIYSDTKWSNYSIFSLWDTYRTLNPLYTLIAPDMVDNIVNSFLSIYDQQGKLPIWPLWNGETNCMPGYSSVPIIADAYLKGFKGFDATKAFNCMISTATNDAQNGVKYVKEKGYIPCDKIHEATSIAMEYAADDWGIALMAKKMGKTEDYQKYLQRGKYYAQYFDKSINFIRPKMDNGSWRTPYDPFQSIHGVGDFTEGTGWQYTFFVPQHPEGLIALFGGDKAFTTKLDSLFSVHGDMGAQASNDISGLIGQYAHGNEPSHHMAYLYPYAGEQWKTAEKVRYIQDAFYTDKNDGIIGNEDCGQMSAWHIMSALGFYQVNPSNGTFVFGSPLFDKASIKLPKGKTFDIVAQNNSKQNIYIQSVKLNGKPYTKSYITYNDIVNGGNLTFVMGSTPNKQFGTAPEDRPKSAE